MRREGEQSGAACKQNSPDAEKEEGRLKKKGEQEICSDGSIKGGIYAGRGEKAGLMQEGWLREWYWDIQRNILFYCFCQSLPAGETDNSPHCHLKHFL